jgi:hypothetical protein
MDFERYNLSLSLVHCAHARQPAALPFYYNLHKPIHIIAKEKVCERILCLKLRRLPVQREKSKGFALPLLLRHHHRH